MLPKAFAQLQDLKKLQNFSITGLNGIKVEGNPDSLKVSPTYGENENTLIQGNDTRVVTFNKVSNEYRAFMMFNAK